MAEIITDYTELSDRLNRLKEILKKYSAGSELIKKVEDKIKWEILRKTAYSLPNRPSDAGMSPEQIKSAFYKALTDGESSVLAELDRVIADIDTELFSLSDIIKELVVSLEGNRENIKALSESTALQIGEAMEQIEEHSEEITKRATKDYVDSHFVGRSGAQAIDGELAVKRLYVEGTTYSTDLGSLNVKDRFICANSDGVPMAGLTGFVLRVNGGEAYGIVHDTAGRCVKIGLGVYDSDSGEFVFKDGEAQALATRGEISGGELPVWDSEASTFKGSGIKAKDIAAQHAVFARRDEVAGALKGSAMGEAVVLEGVSPIEHSLGVKVSSKNKLDFKNITIAYNPASGITYNKSDTAIEINNDGNTYNGSVTFNVPMTDDMWGKTLTLSYKHEAVGMRIAQISLFFNKGGTQVFSGNAPNGVGTFTAPNKGEADSIQIRFTCYLETSGVAGSITYSEVQVEKGTSATYPRPYVADVSAVKLRVQGGNLTPYPYSFTEKTLNGATFKVNEDGSIEVKGTPSENVATPIWANNMDATPFRGKQLSISFTDWSWYYFVHIMLDDGTWQYNFLGSRRNTTLTGTVPNNAVKIQMGVGTLTEFDGSENTIYPHLWVGDSVGEYEPYISPIEYAQGDDIRSICPTTTLTTDTAGALIEVEYNRDINKAFEKLQNAIISLGGNL